jgi:hypothetical protein
MMQVNTAKDDDLKVIVLLRFQSLIPVKSSARIYYLVPFFSDEKAVCVVNQCCILVGTTFLVQLVKRWAPVNSEYEN